MVRDYIKIFLKLSMYVEELNENMKMKKFVLGLEYFIKVDVSAQRPSSLKEAMRLAELYEPK